MDKQKLHETFQYGTGQTVYSTELPTLPDSTDDFLFSGKINQSGYTNLTIFLILDIFCPLNYM